MIRLLGVLAVVVVVVVVLADERAVLADERVVDGGVIVVAVLLVLFGGGVIIVAVLLVCLASSRRLPRLFLAKPQFSCSLRPAKWSIASVRFVPFSAGSPSMNIPLEQWTAGTAINPLAAGIQFLTIFFGSLPYKLGTHCNPFSVTRDKDRNRDGDRDRNRSM